MYKIYSEHKIRKNGARSHIPNNIDISDSGFYPWFIQGQSSADPAIAKYSKKFWKILLYTLAYIKTYYLCLYWPTQQENYNNFITTTTNGPTMCGNRMCSDRRMVSETWNYDRSADRQIADRRTDSVVGKFHFQQRKILGFTLAFISSSQNIICIFTDVRVDVFRNRQVYGFIIITE